MFIENPLIENLVSQALAQRLLGAASWQPGGLTGAGGGRRKGGAPGEEQQAVLSIQMMAFLVRHPPGFAVLSITSEEMWGKHTYLPVLYIHTLTYA